MSESEDSDYDIKLALSRSGDDVTLQRLSTIQSLLQQGVEFKLWHLNDKKTHVITHIRLTKGEYIVKTSDVNDVDVSTNFSKENSARLVLKLVRDYHDIDLDITLSNFKQENSKKTRKGKGIEFRWPESELLEKQSNREPGIGRGIMQMNSSIQKLIIPDGQIVSELYTQIAANVQEYNMYRELYDDWDDDELLEIT